MLLCLSNRTTDQRKERKRGPRENAAITKGMYVSFSMWINLHYLNSLTELMSFEVHRIFNILTYVNVNICNND